MYNPHILPLTMKFPTNFCQLALTPPPPPSTANLDSRLWDDACTLYSDVHLNKTETGTKEMTHLMRGGGSLSSFMDRFWRFFGSMPNLCYFWWKKKSDPPPHFPPLFQFPHPLFLKYVKHRHAWCLWSINRAKVYYFWCFNLPPSPTKPVPP